MSDMTCRKTMMRCPTPGMCAPHGGCTTREFSDEAHERLQLCMLELDKLKVENERLRNDDAGYQQGAKAEADAGDEARKEVKRLKGLLHMMVTQAMPLEDIPNLPGYSRIVDANRLVAENEALRLIISRSATAAGAAISSECSLDFMALLPAEIVSSREKLRAAVLFAADQFQTQTSADGSGHADIGRTVLRIAGLSVSEEVKGG